jgi:hypothetical protein
LYGQGLSSLFLMHPPSFAGHDWQLIVLPTVSQWQHSLSDGVTHKNSAFVPQHFSSFRQLEASHVLPRSRA